MGVWDVSTPTGSDLVSQGDDRIRELKTAIQEALRGGTTDGLEALFPGSAPSTAPVFHYRGLKGTTAARPAAGQFGLYHNETLNTIQRDNGSAWQDVATLIPSGTKMVFYQASAPTGWTAVAVNDKFLRVVTAGGTGGTTGGSGLAPSSTVTLAHSHTVNSHNHGLGSHTHSTPNHQHFFDYVTASTSGDNPINSAALLRSVDSEGDGARYKEDASGTSVTWREYVYPRTTSGGGSTTGAASGNTDNASPGTDSQLLNTGFQYADIIIATKD